MEGEYHDTPHRGLNGLTPLERWAHTGAEVRFPEPELDLDELFLFEITGKVQADRTVSPNGTLDEFDAALIGVRVTLRYGPSVPPGRPIEVRHEGKAIQLACVVDAYANCLVKRHRPSWTLCRG